MPQRANERPLCATAVRDRCARRISSREAVLLAILTALTFLTILPAHADSPAPIFIPVALAPVQRDTPVELVALTLDADISESGGHTLLSGNSTFKLHNTDRLNDFQVNVGFPAWAGDPFAFDPTRLDAFSVSVDGKKVTLNLSRADFKVGSAVRTVDWYTFTLPIAGDEKKTVRLDFQQDLGEGALPRFTYGLTPAASWKGSIGSARLTLRFPETTTLEQIIAYDPPNPDFDGQSLTWRFTSREPPYNPSLTILRPSLWDNLLARRRTVQQNPNDANAHAALGELFAQLALSDSPRRDSFYAQAVAELETATRLDPNQRSAQQFLATLYESRAGPATGPRQAAYVLLAATQWEALASSNANARKQLAEDYFYLGLDAQTRRAFVDALAYFDKANTLAPNGAGPLFTSERAAAQRRALNIVWARALLDKQDLPTAAEKARAALGDASMASFKPPLFYITRAQVTMSSHSRLMVFRLAPFAAQPTELQNMSPGVVTALRAAGADANISFDNPDYTLRITVLFNTRAELTDQLTILAKTLPDRAEWSLARAVFLPSALAWEEQDELWAYTTRYREEVNLSAACGTFQAQLDAIAQSLVPLENAPTTDDEAQLKRALLKNARSGWQGAFSSGQVTFQSGTNTARVDACTARTLAWSSSTPRAERIALIVAGIELIGGGILFVRWRRNPRRRT